MPEGRLDRFASDVRSAVGAPHYVTDPDVLAVYEQDWTGRWHGKAAAAARPATTAQVAAVVRAARRHGVAVAVRGGGTGLVGGAVPTADGSMAVLSTERLKGVTVDPLSATADVWAGTTLQELNDAARPHGLMFAVDLGSRGSCTLGGMVATNAGGLRVLRWGDTSHQVIGVEAVDGHGDILTHTQGLLKDNTGVRWHSILAGSEGTLAVLCRLVVRLVPVPERRAYAWFPVTSADEAVTVAAAARRDGAVSAVEYVEARGVNLVIAVTGRTPPTRTAAVIVEASTGAGGSPADALAVLAARVGADDALCADGPGAAEMWEWRDRHTESISTVGVPAKCDVGLPLNRWAEFHDRVPDALNTVDQRLWCVRFGHVADGNLHVNVLMDDGSPPPPDADDAVWQLAAELGGSVSAEHGIGVAKAKWLPLSRTPAELVAVERIRGSWDPGNVLSPHLLRGDWL